MKTEKLLAMLETDELREVGESKTMKYYADRLGNVYSLTKVNHKARQLKAYKHSHGYMMVTINSKSKLVHRLVATAFIPNPNNYPQVNHIDGDKTNNRCTDDASNLEWCTAEYNTQHSIDHGLNQRRKLTHEERMLIADTFDKDIEQSMLSISRELDLDYQTVRTFIQSYKKSQYKRLIETELNNGKAIIEMNRNQLQITNTLSTSERIKLDIQNKTNEKESK